MNPLDLLLLACPAMMVVCVFGMRGRGGQQPTTSADEGRSLTAPNAALEERLADLMVENDELRRRLDPSETAASSADAAWISEERRGSRA